MLGGCTVTTHTPKRAPYPGCAPIGRATQCRPLSVFAGRLLAVAARGRRANRVEPGYELETSLNTNELVRVEHCPNRLQAAWCLVRPHQGALCLGNRSPSVSKDARIFTLSRQSQSEG